MVFEIRERTDRRTDMLIAMLRIQVTSRVRAGEVSRPPICVGDVTPMCASARTSASLRDHIEQRDV